MMVKNSRLVKQLSVFSKKELRQLRKFLQSPFFNQRQDLLDLFDLLCQPLEDHLSQELLYQQLFPNKPFDIQHLRLLMSYLIKLVEQFIQVSAFQLDHFNQEKHLIKALRQYQLPEAHFRKLNQLSQSLEQQTHRNEEYWQQITWLNWEQYRLESTQKPQDTLNLSGISDAMDTAYFAAKLRLACFALANQGVYKKDDWHPYLIEEILKHIEDHKLLNITVLRVYYFCYQMLSTSNSEGFFTSYKQSLLGYGDQFPLEEIRDLYLLSINFCIRQVNDGNWDKRFFYEVLELYKNGLSEGYLLEDGVLSRFTYYNAVVAALKVKEYDYAAEIIENYRDSLEKKYRNSAYSFNKARLEYAQKNYNAALELLQTSNYRDVLLNLAARVIGIKIYYEIEAISLLEAQIEAMKLFLRRKKIVAYHRELFRSFLHYTQGLISLNHYDKAAVKRFRAAILNDNKLTEKEWLLEQLEK